MSIALILTCTIALSACDLEIPGFGNDDDNATPVASSDPTPVPEPESIEDPDEFEEPPAGQASHQVPDEAFQIPEIDEESGQQSPARIVEAGTQEPRTLNPVLVGDPLSEALSQLVFSGLVRIDPASGETVPDLAESWEIDEAETTYTFHLREGITWHDGQPLTAQDIEFTFDLMMDDRTRSPRFSRIVERVAAVETIDPRTIQFRLISPYSPFLSTIATFGIVPQHVLSNVLPNELVADPFGTSSAVGTGPFVFGQWDRAERIVFEAFQGYHHGRPAFDQYEFRIVVSEDEILEGLEDGSIHWAQVSPETFEAAGELSNINAVALPSYEMVSVVLQLDTGVTSAFEDANVRRALLHAIDRDAMVTEFWNGHAEIAHSIIPSVSWAANEPESRYDFDPGRAGELLSESGWELNEAGNLMRDGAPLTFTIVANGENPLRRALVNWLVQQWRDVGFDARVHFETWGSVRDRITSTRQFDALIFGYRWDIDPDQHPVFSSDSIPDGFNIGSYINRDVDRLLEEALIIRDDETRAQRYAEAQEMILQDLPILPLAFPNQLILVGPRLHAEEQTAILVRNRANVAEWIPENDEAAGTDEAES